MIHVFKILLLSPLAKLDILTTLLLTCVVKILSYVHQDPTSTIKLNNVSHAQMDLLIIHQPNYVKLLSQQFVLQVIHGTQPLKYVKFKPPQIVPLVFIMILTVKNV